MSRIALGVAVAAAIVGLAFVADNYALRLATTVMMYSVLALSWNFIGGFAGYPSFATAAFFGLGAYAGGVLQHAGVGMVTAWLSGGIVTVGFALALGAAILHLRGHYFAIASLVVADVLREIANVATGITGGGMGLNIAVVSTDMVWFTRLFYFAMLTVAAATLGTTWLIDRSKLGFGLRCIQQNEDAAVILGVNTVLYKVAAFALSGGFVGVAGAVYGSWVNYIDPADAFDVLISVKPIIMVLLGGPGTILGPVAGAAMFLLFEEAVWRNFLTLHEGLLGAIVVLLVLFLPQGLARYRAVLAMAWPRRTPVMSALLELDRVSRSFGGLRALDGVSLNLAEGEIVGLIGPNGAGKTTLVNLVTGVHPVSAGEIRFRGARISGRAPFRIARLGIARTFQVVQPFPRMSVLDNVAAGALFAAGVADIAAARVAAMDCLEFTGLADVAQQAGATLSLANRKRLELAKSLATKPRLLLLDEVNAGLNSTEIDHALRLIADIAARGITILLIEHLMKVVTRACSRVIVLHQGQVISDGPTAAVMRDRKVVEAYLGARYASAAG